MFESHRLGILIPFLAITLGLGIPLSAILFDFLKRRRFMELQHQQRMAAIEKGIDLPPMSFDMVDHKQWRGYRPNYLLRGLVWLLIGATLTIAIYANEEFRRAKALFGLIPTGIGLAYLIYYFAEGKNLMEERRIAETKPPTVT